MNIMLLSPYAQDIARLVMEEKVPVVTMGAGNPAIYMEQWKASGVKVIPVVASVAMARMMERSGADAVIAEGCESGGHIREATTMSLVPQVADAVSIPVIAAGGIADGRGLAAALMLGTSGVQVGTRFLTAEECMIHPLYKEKILRAKDIDTVVTGRSTGHPIRCLRNRMTRTYLAYEKEGKGFEELEALTIYNHFQESTALNLPGGNGVRGDSLLYEGCRIPPYYDSMLAKIIVHGNTRNEAIARMRKAIGELVIEGLTTNTDFQYELVGSRWFLEGDTDAINAMLEERCRTT